MDSTRRIASFALPIVLAASVLVARPGPAIATDTPVVPTSTLEAPAADLVKTAAPAASWVPGEVVVQYRVGSTAGRKDALASVDAESVDHLAIPGLAVVELPKGQGVQDAVRMLERSRAVEFAEPNYRYAADTLPNEPLFPQLWGMNNTGQAVGGVPGTPDADIDAPEAWDTTTGSSDVVVAVVDTGIFFTHTDLDGNLYTNPGETGGGKETNGIDDDLNGFIDDWRGWDFSADDNDAVDQNNHGTHVAGTIGAEGNNGSGVVGVNWDVSLMSVRVLNASGQGSNADIAEGLDYAGDMGVKVVNASLGGGTASIAMENAIEAHPDTLYVFAAGNNGYENDVGPHYPCSYDSANIVCVAGSDKNDVKPTWSNWGQHTVDIAAPGERILSSIQTGSYSYFTGTSMASPHVAGAAALLLAAHPTWTEPQLKSALLGSVDLQSAFTATTASGGRLNVASAIGYDVSKPTIWDFTPDRALVGAEILITGTGFAGATDVSFNGTPATFVEDSDAQLRAVVPVGVTDGPITITAPGGMVTSGVPFGLATPPLNDDFADAVTLVGDTVDRVGDDNFDATSEPGEPEHYPESGGKSVWYQWTAPRSGRVVVTTSGSDYDTVLAAYSGSALNALTSLASNDDVQLGIVTTSEIAFIVQGGETYSLAVDGWRGSDGNVQVHLVVDSTAEEIAQAIAVDPGVITHAAWVTAVPGNSVGGSPLAGFPRDNTTFGIMSDGPGEFGGASVRGEADYDVSILKVKLEAPPGTTCLSLDHRFLTNEEPGVYYRSDAFVAELDRSTWRDTWDRVRAPHAFAFQQAYSEMFTPGVAEGTDYSVGSPLITSITPADPGPHRLYLSIFDHGDFEQDSAVFVDRMLFGSDAGACTPVAPDLHGPLDPAFGDAGKVTTNFGGEADVATAVAVQEDGKILATGVSSYGLSNFALARYNTDGTRDSDFGNDGKVVTDFSGDADRGIALAIQDDGKILVAGKSSSPGTWSDFALARYETDGSLDTSFGTGGKVVTDFDSDRDIAKGIAIQDDGAIVLVGRVENPGGRDFGLARYDADGSLDTSFGGDGKVLTNFGSTLDMAEDVAVDADGRIVVVGSTHAGARAMAVARYLTDGSLDVDLGGDGKLTTVVGWQAGARAVDVSDAGKVVVAGRAFVKGDHDFVIARYLDDGTFDTSFSGDGIVTTNFGGEEDIALDVIADGAGNIVAAGRSSYNLENFAAARYDDSGTLDLNFGGDGRIVTDFAGEKDAGFAVAVQPNDRVVIAGRTHRGLDDEFALARYILSPATQIDSGPSGMVADDDATFTFSSLDTGATFDCRLDGGGWSACSSPADLAGLSVGPHTFEVRASLAGVVDPTPATRGWEVTGAGTETVITKGPDDPINGRRATFEFMSPSPGATFACSLDGGGFVSCTSPRVANNLSEGPHTFAVRATAGAVADATPATWSWTMDRTSPDTTILTGPSGQQASTSATVTFAANDAPVLFKCSLDATTTASYKNCSSPKTFTGLSDGQHTIRVKAIDMARNADPSPAAVSFLVDSSLSGCTVTGTIGNDTLVGTAADDVICGGGGTDQLTASGGNDELRGGDGNDTLISGPGFDIMDGGPGTDLVSYATATSGVTADLITGTVAGAGFDVFVADGTGVSTIENLKGTNFPDDLGGDGRDNVLQGLKGSDGIWAYEGSDAVSAGPGSDHIHAVDGVEGNDTIDGGTGPVDAVNNCQADPGDVLTNC